MLVQRSRTRSSRPAGWVRTDDGETTGIASCDVCDIADGAITGITSYNVEIPVADANDAVPPG
jgi:hypothetical protein